MHTTTHHLCDGSDYREVEYKAMTDHQVWELIDALNRISGTLERIWKSIDPFGSEKYFTDEIQHVGYDEEQCGRTK